MSDVLIVLAGLLTTLVSISSWVALAFGARASWILPLAVITACGAAAFWIVLFYVFKHLARM